jgi:hypothetical protein
MQLLAIWANELYTKCQVAEQVGLLPVKFRDTKILQING